MTTSYMNRARGRSISQQPSDDELLNIERQFEFINTTFKYSVNDLDNIISMLRARSAAEDAYLTALHKVKKMASTIDNERPSFNTESKLTFQNAVKLYESTVVNIIDGRQRLRDKLRTEIEYLVQEKEQEDVNRKALKNKLSEANLNYTTFRNRDIVKAHKAYTHKCEDLAMAQNNWQQQQQQQQQQIQQQQQQQQQQQNTNLQGQYNHSPDGTNDYYKPNRNSADLSGSSRLSGEHASRDMDSVSILSYNNLSDQYNKKGVAGLLNQMRGRAAGGNYIAPLDQNKQITKVAKMKKEITEADGEYRESVLVLENLRKKQTKTAEEVTRQLKGTIMRKTDSVKHALTSILQSELETLKVEVEMSSASYAAAANIDSTKDIQTFSYYYQAQRYNPPTPVRYENFYLEGKCREVLFGGSLETYALEHNRTVPTIVTKCIEAIENMGGLQKEGIYRVSGRQTNIEQLKHQFELDEDKVAMETYDVFTIATVLKMYIRELKRPLFEFSVQTRSAYSKNMPQNQRFQLMETKLSNLSLAHRSTLHYIIRHLSQVNANSKLNKMNIQNLALIFTPVIFHDFNQTDENTLSDWSPEDLFEDLILHYEFLFPISEENARKNNEHKLALALNGKSPYSQFSQSNLLYLSKTALTTPTPIVTNNMLLTQPMSPAMLMGANGGAESPGGPNSIDQQYNNSYPPKLTTIIGTAPSVNAVPQNQQQRLASLQPQQSYSTGGVRPVHNPINNTSDPNTRIVPPRYQSDALNTQYQQQVGMNRSTSDTTVIQRGSSMNNTPAAENANVNVNFNYSGPASSNNSNSNSPLPSNINVETGFVPALTKRESSSFLQQQGYAKPGAPPRHDSLRKLNSRVQSAGEKSMVSEEQTNYVSSMPFTNNEQQNSTSIPPQIVTSNLTEQGQSHKHQQYYHSGLHQDYMLPSANESNLDSFVDYYSPVNPNPLSFEPKTSPK